MATTQEYAISHWPDTDEILTQLDQLVKSPMRPIRRDRMEEYLDYFSTRCARSKALTDQAKQLIPGGVQHNLAFNYPFPLCVEKVDGAYMWDVDGNQYVDFLQAGGPTVLTGGLGARVANRVSEAKLGKIMGVIFIVLGIAMVAAPYIA